MRKPYQVWLPVLLVCFATVVASAQSFQVQCPTSTGLHPATNPFAVDLTRVEPSYSGPVSTNYTVTQADGATQTTVPILNNGGAIKCQQLSGGDGFATMGDGTQTYLFAFGPLSGLNDMANGYPTGGTQFAHTFNTPYDPVALAGTDASNGAVGLADPATGHVDTRQIMDVGVLNGNMPAPLMSIDEDDEFFLTLTNVGQVMRPDLFEQHTVHFHGYPNASSFYDGVPDASVAINIGGSFTYYYLAPDAGTYIWHCHITPPEHLQMGMVGQLYVRPRQNRVPTGVNLYDSLVLQQGDLRTKCGNDILCATPLPFVDATHPKTSATGGFSNGVATKKFAYNDGDGSTAYDVEYPIQLHGFDPSFHFVGMTFNPENFTDMKDKHFLLNGRSYPDTVNIDGYNDDSQGTGLGFVGQPASSKALYTQSTDGVSRPSQPLSTLIKIPSGGKALLRLSSLEVTEFQSLASLGIPMEVIALNARLLRDQAGNNLYYKTNSITLGGGESLDVILDANGVGDGHYFLYTPQLDHLSNDAENFGGLMTEVVVGPCTVDAHGQCN